MLDVSGTFVYVSIHPTFTKYTLSDAMPGGEDTGRVHLIPGLYGIARETVKEKGREPGGTRVLWGTEEKGMWAVALEGDMQCL